MSKSDETRDLDAYAVYAEKSGGAGRLGWAFGIVSLVAVGISFAFLYVDLIYDENWIWPIYAIMVSGSFCAGAWGNIFSKMGWFVP